MRKEAEREMKRKRWEERRENNKTRKDRDEEGR